MIYISGQITGLSKNEYERNFQQAYNILLIAGKKPLNPLKLKHPFKFYWGYMFVDILALLFCSEIYMMKNWKESRGAKIEHKIAKRLKKKITYEDKRKNDSN